MAKSVGSVIIVDDDPAVLHSLKFALEVEGFDVHTYSSGRELLAEAIRPPKACLVINYVMPEMNGLDLLKKLREQKFCLPAIMITDNITDAVRRGAKVLGLQHVLEKPLLDNSLLSIILASLELPRSDAN